MLSQSTNRFVFVIAILLVNNISSTEVPKQVKTKNYQNQTCSYSTTKTSINYKTVIVKTVQPTDLVVFQIDQFAVSPFLCVSDDDDGTSSIKINIPEKSVAVLFEKALHELENDNYEEVKNLYQKAYNLDSLYFKAASNLGDAWSFLGNYKKAEYYLKKAVKLNNAGYQEYLFLANTYDKSGKNNEAIDAITRAFMLNKNNPYLLESLKDILAKNKLKIKENRLEFPFNVKKTGVRECEIQLADSQGLNWMPMAKCLAFWKMEPDCQLQLNGENAYTAKVKMYRQCFLSQKEYIQKKKMSGYKITSDEEQFLKKIKYENAIIYWEIIAGEEPLFMYYLPVDEREMVVKYIKNFVYGN